MKLIDAHDLWSDIMMLPHNGDMISSEEVEQAIKDAPTVDAAPVVHGRWEWFEEWNPSTPDHPRECDDCGWRCGQCKTPLVDMVGGYWDDFYETPKLSYCPNCGAKMDEGERIDSVKEKITYCLRIALYVLVAAAVIFAFLVIIWCEFDLAISRLSLSIILAVSALCSCWLGWWAAK